MVEQKQGKERNRAREAEEAAVDGEEKKNISRVRRRRKVEEQQGDGWEAARGGEAVLVAALMEARWWIGRRCWCWWMVAKMALVMAWWMVQIEWMDGCVARRHAGLAAVVEKVG